MSSPSALAAWGEEEEEEEEYEDLKTIGGRVSGSPVSISCISSLRSTACTRPGRTQSVDARAEAMSDAFIA